VADLISPIHILLILIVALLVFGPRRLPEIGQGIGKGIREFRRAMSGLTETPEDDKSDYTVKVEDPTIKRD
jgi:sec-independent protein translocase protein TatA